MDSTDGRNGQILIIEKLVGRGPNVRGLDGIDTGKDFGRRHATSIVQEGSTNFFGDIVVSVQVHEHGGLEGDLGAFDFGIGRIVYQSDQVVHNVPGGIIDLVVRHDRVDAKEAGIFVTCVEGVERVGEFVLGHVLAQVGRVVLSHAVGAIVGSQHELHQHERKGVLGSPRGSGEGNGQMSDTLRVELDTVNQRKV
jgi:hypothetical protein